MRLLALALLAAGVSAVPVAAEEPTTGASDDAGDRSSWRWALMLSDEGSLRTGLPTGAESTSNIVLAQPSGSWRYGDRARAVGSLSGILLSEGPDTTSKLRVREAYAGLTAGEFDFAVGKKMLRWSNGYAFAPAGVLDPPRRVTDPTDRLGLNEGRGLALASLVQGRHAVTVAWASAGLVENSRPGLREVSALRYNVLVRGIDASLILAHRRGLGAFGATTFTAVVGSRLEIHGDFAFGSGSDSVEGAPTLRLGDERRLAALLGAKVSLPWRASGIIEICSEDGLVPVGNGAAVEASTAGTLTTERRHRALFHISKGRLRDLPGWRNWDAGVALLLDVSGGGGLLVVDVEHRVRQRLALHGRLSLPGSSSAASDYGMIPWTSEVSLSLRLQM